VLSGGAGNDTIYGGAGNDTLAARHERLPDRRLRHRTTADYSPATSAVTVNLGHGAAQNHRRRRYRHLSGMENLHRLA
jgi:Ca2+-binding RTX toxin-like protein